MIAGRGAAPAAVALATAALAGPAATAAPDPNPCHGPFAGGLLCPRLSMSAPADMRFEHAPGGRLLLRATSSINNVGAGPVELHGKRTGPLTMSATQRIYRRGGRGYLTVRTGAQLGFKAIPGQYRYWKLRDAARFELWSLDGRGRRVRLVRTGPKLFYCLRDLRRTHPMPRSPRRFRYPGCSQDPNAQSVTLGTSVGWSDIYPATYYEQYIDVTGLHGRFAYVLIADPTGVVDASNVGPIEAQRVVRLR